MNASQELSGGCESGGFDLIPAVPKRVCFSQSPSIGTGAVSCNPEQTTVIPYGSTYFNEMLVRMKLNKVPMFPCAQREWLNSLAPLVVELRIKKCKASEFGCLISNEKGGRFTA